MVIILHHEVAKIKSFQKKFQVLLFHDIIGEIQGTRGYLILENI